MPELDVADIDDLMLGCGLPGGEQGFNTGRVVAVLLGLDRVPGTTITRYCASSLQTSRMAMHAIKAGEGDVFISAGVETVSRFLGGSSIDDLDLVEISEAFAIWWWGVGRSPAGVESGGAAPAQFDSCAGLSVDGDEFGDAGGSVRSLEFVDHGEGRFDPGGSLLCTQQGDDAA